MASVVGFFKNLLRADFMPHGHCFFWRPEIVWLHVSSDLLITLAYYSIPLMLLYFVRKRRETIPFHWMFVLFSSFIFWCGTTHLMGVITLWHPIYRLEGMVKAITAGVSVFTAILLFRIVPQMLSLKGPKELEALNTELRKTKQELEITVQQRTRELLETNEKLAASNSELQQFAYVVSHDLQEPLRMISTYLQMVEQRGRPVLDEEVNEYIDFAVDGSRRMKFLIEDLLSLARIGHAKEDLQPLDFNKIVARAEENLTASINETGARISVGRLPTLTVDSVQMVQLFQNLIGNALKYRSENKPEIHIEAEQIKEGWVFSVRDNGIGIGPEYSERIFIVFQRLHTDRKKYPGTGIGLAICKKIVEHHRGRIWVESTVGKGSIFRFTLPRGPA